MKKLYCILLLCVLLTTISSLELMNVKVCNVVDGDTIDVVDKQGTVTRIRLWGIDCPERSQKYGMEAKQYLLDTILNKNVDVVIKDIDRYGRTVGIVYSKNSIINGLLVLYGYAWVYEKYCDDNYFYNMWIKLEHAARDNQINIWSNSNPVAPWDYRKKKK